MPEYRKDIILDEWVIIATERAKRPENFREEKIKVSQPSNIICPFDKGNEHMTPPEVLRVDKEGNFYKNNLLRQKNYQYIQKSNTQFEIHQDEKLNNFDDWQIRVVPNKFPALIPNAQPVSHQYGIYMSMDGFGVHEVVIHSPEHITNISNLNYEQIKILTDVYIDRIKDISNDRRIESVIIMLNQGKDAGASIEHSHSQIFALPLIPPVLEKEIHGTRRYYKQSGKCATCAIIDFELKEGKRVVYKNKCFLVIQPYASRNPFETWIVPLKHYPNFESISNNEVEAFADCLKRVVDFFYYELNEPSYNYYIHTGPLHLADVNFHYHWNFELIPKFSIKAGFEIATGIDICITTPEHTADFMKKSKFFK